jgi:serpin B
MKFNKNLTQTEPFYMADKTEKNVQMMGLNGKKFNFSHEPASLKANTCTLPYAGGNISMTIILPHEDQKLSDVEMKLDSKAIATILSVQNKRKVNVFLPKFKIEQQFEVVYFMK